jgi:hypothetical protein
MEEIAQCDKITGNRLKHHDSHESNFNSLVEKYLYQEFMLD